MEICSHLWYLKWWEMFHWPSCSKYLTVRSLFRNVCFLSKSWDLIPVPLLLSSKTWKDGRVFVFWRKHKILWVLKSQLGWRRFCVCFFKSGYCLLAFCLILVPPSFHESLPEVTFNLKKLKLTDLSTFGMTFTLVGRGRE